MSYTHIIAPSLDRTRYYPIGLSSTINPFGSYEDIFTYDSLKLNPKTLGLAGYSLDKTPYTKVDLYIL